MRRAIVPVLLFPLLACGGDGSAGVLCRGLEPLEHEPPRRGCTMELRCLDGFRVNLELGPGVWVFEGTADGEPFRCEHRSPEDYVGTCTPANVRSDGGGLRFYALPCSVELAVHRDGVPVLERRLDPDYVTENPYSEGCGNPCTEATIDLALP